MRYYHVVFEVYDSNKNQKYDHEYRTDLKAEDLQERYVTPYETGKDILINGSSFSIDKIKRLRVFASDEASKILKQKEVYESDVREAEAIANGVFFVDVSDHLLEAILKQEDVTDDFVRYAKGTKPKKDIVKSAQDEKIVPTKVFIVHGHDDALINEVKAFLSALRIEPVILREQHNTGLTIIEKLEKSLNDKSIGFGIVLYTPDDEGKSINETNFKLRARQNVVFEHGLLMGLYGRNRVASLVKHNSSIDMPGDVNGVVYTSHAQGDWRLSMAHMLTDAGYEIDYRKIV
ncbi:nucleotide-binding protein [Acinetobacter baumannii]|nr:nucleotide-binding protein [Acinetobacter baumannii]